MTKGVKRKAGREGGREGGDVPMTSADSRAAIAISAVIHNNMEKRVGVDFSAYPYPSLSPSLPPSLPPYLSPRPNHKQQ